MPADDGVSVYNETNTADGRRTWIKPEGEHDGQRRGAGWMKKMGQIKGERGSFFVLCVITIRDELRVSEWSLGFRARMNT